VLGREFVYEMLAGLSSVGETVLQEGLGQLVKAELLYQRGRPPRATYIFKHALIQDAAYQSLLRRTRQYYHRQVAELLQSRFAEIVEAQPELVAHHLTEADMAEPAIALWQQAGERAAARSANAEAVTQLTKAIGLLGSLDESKERDARELDLQIALAGSLIALKGYAAPETEETYVRALELCDRTGDPHRIFPVLYGRWAYQHVLGQITESEPLSAEFVRRADGQTDPVPRVVGHRIRGTTLMVAGQPADALEHFSRAHEIYDPENHRDEAFRYGQDVRVTTLVYQALTLWYLGLSEQAQRRSQEALSRARQLGHANTLAYTYYHTGWLRMLSTTPAEVLEIAEDTIAISEEHRMPLWAAAGRLMRSWCHLQEGCTAARITMLEENLMGYGEYLGLARPMFLTWLATAYGAVKQPEKGQEIAAETQALIESTGEAHYQAELFRVRGELERIRGADDEAEAQFEQAFSTARRQSIKPFELRAAASIARLRRDKGKHAAARDLLAPVYDWFTEGFHTPDLMDAKVLLDELS
jgi:predicted ATPase